MSDVARYDEAIRAAGLPLISVRKHSDGTFEPVLADDATPAQRRQAAQVIADYAPTPLHRFEDAARKRGLTPEQLAALVVAADTADGRAPRAEALEIAIRVRDEIDAELA